MIEIKLNLTENQLVAASDKYDLTFKPLEDIFLDYLLWSIFLIMYTVYLKFLARPLRAASFFRLCLSVVYSN